jgi:hypothetical protein
VSDEEESGDGMGRVGADSGRTIAAVTCLALTEVREN